MSHPSTSGAPGVVNADFYYSYSSNNDGGTCDYFFKPDLKFDDGQKLDVLRRKFNYYSKKYVITERSLNYIQETLNQIDSSVLHLNKSTRNGIGNADLVAVLDESIEEGKKSILSLQQDILEFEAKTAKNKKSKVNVTDEPSGQIRREVGSKQNCASSLKDVEKRRANENSASQCGNGNGSESDEEEADDEVVQCQRRNEKLLLQEWNDRKKYFERKNEFDKVKKRVNEDKALNSDSVFASLFKQWIELRASEAYLKTEKHLLDEAISRLEKNHSLNLSEVNKQQKVSEDIEALEQEALSNQQKLRTLFEQVSLSNNKIESMRRANVEAIHTKYLPAVAVCETESFDEVVNLSTELDNAMNCLSIPYADDALIDRFNDAVTTQMSQNSTTSNSDFKQKVKNSLEISFGANEKQVLKEMQNRMNSLHQTRQAESQVSQISDGPGYLKTDAVEDVKNKAHKLSRKLDSDNEVSSIDPELNIDLLSDIEQKLLELEDECGQYLVPWVKIDGVNLRQYRQIIKQQYQHNTK